MRGALGARRFSTHPLKEALIDADLTRPDGTADLTGDGRLDETPAAVEADALDSVDAPETTVDPLVSPSRELALRVAEAIVDTPASETLVLDIHNLSSVADCFVICSGENERQLRAIHREVVERMDETGVHPRRVEGTPASGWILIDYGDVVVHIFDVDQRLFYRLEELWAGASILLSMQ